MKNKSIIQVKKDNLFKKNTNIKIIIPKIHYNRYKISINKKIQELLKYIEKYKEIPYKHDEFSDYSYMGIFWRMCKYRNRFKNDKYKILLKNKILYDDYCKYLLNKRLHSYF